LLKGFLEQGHRVHLLIRQPADEIRETLNYPNLEIVSCNNNFPGSKIKGIPGKIYRGLYYRWLRRSVKGPAGIFLLQGAHHIKRILTENKVDAVIFEHLESMMASKYIRSISPKVYQVLDAHNVDHVLYALENVHKKLAGYKALYKRTRWYESHFKQFVDAVLTCSEKDLKVLKQLNNGISGFVVPNGTDTNLKKPDFTQGKYLNKNILFCGDLNTVANSDGLRWFFDAIWPEVKSQIAEVTLTVVGGGENKSDFDDIKSDSQIYFKGRVDNLEWEYNNASVAVAPLRVGSGTRLKILEAMSFGNPVVSTVLGAEGLDITAGEHILIADEPIAFAKSIIQLVTSNELFNKIRIQAQLKVVEKYDWTKVSKMATGIIQNRIYEISSR
jgi:glycosyltransferase involved in cell wall biosynthesis